MGDLFTLERKGKGYVWTEEQIKYINEQYAHGTTLQALGERFGVSQVTVSKLLVNNTPKKRGRKKGSGKLSVCPFCKKKFDPNKEESVPYKKLFAHKTCFESSFNAISTYQKEEDKKRKDVKAEKRAEKQKEQTITFNKTQLKEGMSEEEFQEKKKYLDYLTSLNVEINAKVLAVSDRYIKNYNFTWTSMYWTLVFLHDIRKKDLTNDIVGIIPYYHAEAQKFYSDVQSIEESNKNVNLSTMYKTKTVKIRPPRRRVGQLDIDSIGMGEQIDGE